LTFADINNNVRKVHVLDMGYYIFGGKINGEENT
jgi:hypothetical protein